MKKPPRPPSTEELFPDPNTRLVRTANIRDAWLLTRKMYEGMWYGIWAYKPASALKRAIHICLKFTIFMVALVLFLPTYGAKILQIWFPGARYYILPDRAAIQVASFRGKWRVVDYLAFTRGEGYGEELANLIAPPLLKVADEHGVTVSCTASNEALADRYEKLLPGLKRTGHVSASGVQMLRLPQGK